MISFTHPPTPMNCSTFKSFNYRLCRPAFSLSHASSRFAAFSPFAALFNRRQKCARICVSSSRLHSTSNSGPFMEVVKAAAKQGTAVRDRVAIRADKQSYSYRQIISSALNISKILCSNDLNTTLKHDNSQTSVDGVGEHGHLGGARIGIVAKPSAEFVAGILGTWISGGVAVPLALSYPEAELLHVMNDSEVSVVLSTYDHHESLQEVASKCAAGFHLIPPVPSISSQNDVHDHSQHEEIDEHRFIRESIENSSEDPALIIYTSGTTGKPKGVVHTHKSITAQVQMLAEAWGYAPDDHFLHCLPLHHVHGLFNALLAPLYAGSMVEFMPKFSVRGVWQRWRESYPEDGTKGDGAITVFTGVPTMYSRLIQAFEAMDPEFQAASASAARQLRLMMCGSSALPKPVMQQWETITGHCLLERYGMTEFVMAISNPLKGMRKAGTVGKPFPGVQVKIMPEEENGDCTDGVGELCVKSPSLFKEYWKLPEVTKKSFTDDGFFKTGDAGKVDEDGYYVILGRTSADIMKVGGYKLSALEIESVILQHPAVVECCVLGLPDKDYGEAVTVIIVPDAATKTKREQDLKPALTLLELRTWAEDKLAPYKLPTRLLLWDSLPRNAMGKILNRRSHIRQVMQCYPPLDTKSTSQHTIKTPTPGIGRHNNSLTSERDSENGEGERRRAMEVPDYEREARRYLEDLSKGVSGHEMDNITLEGLQVLQARAGFFRCKYLVPSRLSDQDGNWHVGAMATLMDTVGAATAGSCVEDVKGTLELNISYYSKAKIQEEVEIEAKVVAQKEKMTSVVVEVRKRDKGELIALGKQWMATRMTNQSERSKL